MALTIDETCIACGACEPECPTKSISEGEDVFVIDAATCVECVGHFDAPKCVEVCPVDCIHKA
jgi:ferredoxin